MILFIKRILPAFFLLSFVCGSSALAQEGLFDTAANHYQKGEFEAAKKNYEALIESGHRTPAAYYNIGNTLFRLHKNALSLVNYKRALILAPRDQDVRWNMGVLKSLFQDRFESEDSGILDYWFKKASDYVSVDECAIALTAALLLAVLFGFLRRRVLQLLAVGLVVLIGILFFFKWLDLKDPHAVILAKEVTARYGPSEKETRAFVLHEGAEAKVTDESRDWVYIVLSDKKTGWIPKSACEVI